jgi:hypothetical protein
MGYGHVLNPIQNDMSRSRILGNHTIEFRKNNGTLFFPML